MKIGIVGAGAIGSYYGGMLSLSGEDVHFLLRSDYQAVREHGLQIRHVGEWERTLSVPAYERPEAMGVCDLVIVGLKTTANALMPDLLKPLMGPDSVVLTLQNGLGNTELLVEHFGRDRVLTGLCFVCINRVSPGVIENYLPGRVTIGAVAPGTVKMSVAQAVALFEKAGILCSEASNLEDALWKKLLWNIPFNGLCVAAGGLATDRLLASQLMTEEVRALMEEVRRAAQAWGVTIPEKLVDKQIETTLSMGAYRPSSMIDFVEGRPMEVESIWGEPLRRAESRGVCLPRLRQLYALLSLLNG